MYLFTVSLLFSRVLLVRLSVTIAYLTLSLLFKDKLRNNVIYKNYKVLHKITNSHLISNINDLLDFLEFLNLTNLILVEVLYMCARIISNKKNKMRIHSIGFVIYFLNNLVNLLYLKF